LDQNTNDKRRVHETKKFLKKSSQTGYRTLLIAMRVLDHEEVEQFVKNCDEAEKDV
jgi:hypothetical protein